MKRNVLLTPHLCLYSQKDLDVGHCSDLDQKQSGIPPTMKRGRWDKVAELMMIKFGESGHPVFRATSPLSRGTLKSKGGGKLSVHFCADGDTIETVFRTIISINQLSIYGAVSDTVVVKQGQGDLLWQSNLIHFRASRLIDNDTYTLD